MPNFDLAARGVIRDYLNGKINFFSIPPKVDDDMEDEDMDDSDEQ